VIVIASSGTRWNEFGQGPVHDHNAPSYNWPSDQPKERERNTGIRGLNRISYERSDVPLCQITIFWQVHRDLGGRADGIWVDSQFWCKLHTRVPNVCRSHSGLFEKKAAMDSGELL